MSNYRPQLFLRTADITVALTFPEGTPDAAEKMVCLNNHSPGMLLTMMQVMPGDSVEMICELVHDVAAEVSSR
jgi:GTPases - translation elongation factors